MVSLAQAGAALRHMAEAEQFGKICCGSGKQRLDPD